MHNCPGGFLGFYFVGISWLTYGHSAPNLISVLLDYVSKFVSDEFTTCRTTRLICALTEENVLASGKGPCTQGAIQCVRLCIDMNAHSAEIRTQRPFHLSAHTTIQVVTAAAFLVNRA